MVAAVAGELGIEPARVGRGLDRRDRRPAGPRDRCRGRQARRGGALGVRRRGLLRGDHDERPLAQAREPRGLAGERHRAPLRAGEGRRHALAELRDDALLRADRRARSTPARSTGCCARRSSARSSGSPWTGSCPPTTRCSRSRAAHAGVAVEPGTDDERAFAAALDALLRQLAVEMVADGEGAERVARLVVRGAVGGGGAGRARGRQLAAREVRPPRRRPELGPDPPGGRPGGAGRRPVAARASTSRTSTSPARAAPMPLAEAAAQRLEEAMAGHRGGDAPRPRRAPGRRRRSSSATSGTDTCRFNSEYTT